MSSKIDSLTVAELREIAELLGFWAAVFNLALCVTFAIFGEWGYAVANLISAAVSQGAYWSRYWIAAKMK